MQKTIFAALCVCVLLACSSVPSRVTLQEISETGGLLYYQGKPYSGIVFEMHTASQPKDEIHVMEGLRRGNPFTMINPEGKRSGKIM